MGRKKKTVEPIVKKALLYDMGGVNNHAHEKGRLHNVQLESIEKKDYGDGTYNTYAFRGKEHGTSWMNALQFEYFLKNDKKIRTTVQKIFVARNAKSIKPGTIAEKKAIKKLLPHIRRIFEEQMLVDIINKFNTVAELATKYVLAKEADRLINPEAVEQNEWYPEWISQ